MASGYKNRTIYLAFPDLAEEGDDVHVIIRNPRLMPAEELRSFSGGTKGSPEDAERIAAVQAAVAAGEDVPDDLVTDEDANKGYAMIARLVIGWHVYDATSTDDDQPLLPLPATVESVGKLPMEILTRLMQEMNRANPQPSQEAGTGKTS